MANAPKPLPIIFRMYRGELCAYFPTEEWARGQITCYAEGHGGACPSWLRKGRPATEAEYADLLAELRGIYETSNGPDDPVIKLMVYKRTPRAEPAPVAACRPSY